MQANINQIAVIQMNSVDNVEENLSQAGHYIEQAAREGASLVILPEMFAFIGKNNAEQLKIAERDGEGRIQDFLAEQARNHQIWLVGGTVPLKSSNKQQVYATCMLYDAQGERIASYRKIHLFDVYIKERDEYYKESEVFCAGDTPVVVETPFGKLGLAVCYDIRFPELFRLLVDQGAEIVALPAAFTALTGAAHWHVLLKTRAIENLIYLAGATQVGFHANQRETYGHSMIISPWGKIEAELAQGTGIVKAEVNINNAHTIRSHFPCLTHRVFNVEYSNG